MLLIVEHLAWLPPGVVCFTVAYLLWLPNKSLNSRVRTGLYLGEYRFNGVIVRQLLIGDNDDR